MVFLSAPPLNNVTEELAETPLLTKLVLIKPFVTGSMVLPNDLLKLPPPLRLGKRANFDSFKAISLFNLFSSLERTVKLFCHAKLIHSSSVQLFC